jgi:hypothetical protein
MGVVLAEPISPFLQHLSAVWTGGERLLPGYPGRVKFVIKVHHSLRAKGFDSRTSLPEHGVTGAKFWGLP